MRPTYKTSRISPDRIDQAYLLVAHVAPALDLDAWRKFCWTVIGRGIHRPDLDNVIVATNPLGYVQGLCIAAVRESDRVLDVPIFVVASAADAAGVAADMLAYLKNVGRAEACVGLRVWTMGQDNWSAHFSEEARRRNDHGVLMSLESDAPLPADVLWRPQRSNFPVKT